MNNLPFIGAMIKKRIHIVRRRLVNIVSGSEVEGCLCFLSIYMFNINNLIVDTL